MEPIPLLFKRAQARPSQPAPGDDPLATFIFVLIDTMLIAIAIRLLLLSQKTKALAERLIGISFLSLALMLLFRSGSMATRFQDLGISYFMLHTGNVLFCVATVTLFFFNWNVFRPTEAWARGLALGGSAITFAVYAARMTLGEEQLEIKLMVNAVRIVPFLWAFFETLRYHAMMRKRSRLGLGDPVVTNRFLLWAIWTGSVSITPLLGLILRTTVIVTGGADPLEGDTAQLVQNASAPLRILFFLLPCTGVAAIASLWLSFFPPPSYERLLRRKMQEARDQ